MEWKYTVCVIRKQEETGASQRTKIKICGLSRPEDIEAVNEVKPAYAGFVVEVSKSRRNVSVQQLRRLTTLLDHGIVSVGVFVNAPVERIVGLLQDGVLAMAQLHGQEDASYVEAVKEQTGRPVVQAFSIRTQEDVQRAFASPADYILLDQAGGGSGRPPGSATVPFHRFCFRSPGGHGGGLLCSRQGAAGRSSGGSSTGPCG